MTTDFVALGSVSPWSFGWDALVALGTLALAGSTIFLALRTAALARSTATDVAAQDRPVLVPAHELDLKYELGSIRESVSKGCLERPRSPIRQTIIPPHGRFSLTGSEKREERARLWVLK